MLVVLIFLNPSIESSVLPISFVHKIWWNADLYIYTHPLTHSPTHPLTHSPTHPLTHTPTHPHTHSPTHPLTHSPTHPLTHSPTHPLTHSPTHPLTHSPTHPLTHSPTHPLTHSPTHPLTHSPTHPLTHSLTIQILSTFFSENMPFLRLPYLTVYHCILYISCKRILSLTKFIFFNTTYKFIYYHSLYFNIMHMYILYLCNLKCIADNICMLIYTLIMFVYITIIC